VHVRGHVLRRGPNEHISRDDQGRGVCTCGEWTTEPGLTDHSIAQAHRDHKADVLEQRNAGVVS
jgi:hypothetical protein